MRVLVLGGTGAMGVHLVRLLDEAGESVVVTSRQKRADFGRVKFVQGDAKDNTFLDSLLSESWDAIVDFMSYPSAAFAERMEAFLAKTAQYVFLSSSRVYANLEVPIRESSPRLLEASGDESFLATDEYALAKARSEDALSRAASTNWTVIRPYITYSENRLQLGVLEKEEWLYRVLKGRTVVFSKEMLAQTTTLTYGYDVARGIKALLGREGALGQAFHITADESLTWLEALNAYAECLRDELGLSPKVLILDNAALMKFHGAKAQIDCDRMFERRFDNSKIRRFIDTSTFTPPKEGLKLCLTRFLKTRDFRAISWGAEAVKDVMSKEITPFWEIKGMRAKLVYPYHRFIKKS